jgi:hypothetical protein
MKYAPRPSSFDQTTWRGRPGKLEKPKWFFQFPTGLTPIGLMRSGRFGPLGGYFMPGMKYPG